MSTATFNPTIDSFMDGISGNADINFGSQTTLSIGLFFVGASKTALRRTICNFDVSSLVGLYASIDAAQLLLTIFTRNVVGSPTGTLYRCTRPSQWTELGVTWNKYDGATAWTNGGGDYDNSTPTPVGFTLPGSGDLTITGLAGFITDAIASRSNVVSLILRDDDESASGSNRQISPYSREGTTPPLLTVTYTPLSTRRRMAQVIG